MGDFTDLHKRRIVLLSFLFLFLIFFVRADSDELMSFIEILDSQDNLSASEQPVQQQPLDTPLTGDIAREEQQASALSPKESSEEGIGPRIKSIKPPEDVSPDDLTLDQPKPNIGRDIPVEDDFSQNETDLLPEEPPVEDLFAGLQPSLPGPKPEGGGLDNPPGFEQGETWERTCDELTCTHKLYQAPKYFFTNEQWQPIDEQFYSTPCLNGYDFCVADNLYQAHMKAYSDNTDAFRFVRDDLSLSFKPSSLLFRTPQQQRTINTIRHSPAQVANNRVQYPLAFGSGIDLHFKYLPHMFKEEINVTTREALPALNISAQPEDITLDFETVFEIAATTTVTINGQVWDKQSAVTTRDSIMFSDGATTFYFIPPVAYDKRGITIPLTSTLERRNNQYMLTLDVPYTWLMNDERVYPVIIDPTITLDDSKILWDGYAHYNDQAACPDPPTECNNPARNGVTESISVGDDDNSPALGFTHYRGDLDWNISSIPDSARLITANFSVSFDYIDQNNDAMFFYHMEGSNSYYPNNDSGNTAFYNDLSNGTLYLTQQATGIPGEATLNIFDLASSTAFKNEFESVLQNGTDAFSVGVRSNETGASGALPSTFFSADATDAAVRPFFEITYQPFANETEGDAAIEQGIVNAFNNASGFIQDNQQIYVYNSTGGHQMGVVDALAINGSKRWTINYVSSGEPFLDLGNMSATTHSLELSDLTSLDIIQRVEDFIRGTL